MNTYYTYVSCYGLPHPGWYFSISNHLPVNLVNFLNGWIISYCVTVPYIIYPLIGSETSRFSPISGYYEYKREDIAIGES